MFYASIEELFLSFDTAKVRRFLQSYNIFYPFSSKKCLSFDIHQAIVCGHSLFVCENTFVIHFLVDETKKGCDCSHPCFSFCGCRSRKTADLQSAPFGHSGKHPFSKPGAKVQHFFHPRKFSSRKMSINCYFAGSGMSWPRQ